MKEIEAELKRQMHDPNPEQGTIFGWWWKATPAITVFQSMALLAVYSVRKSVGCD